MNQSELYAYARRLTNTNSSDWPEADLVTDLNDAMDDIWVRIKAARGVLEFDDAAHTNLSRGTFDLVSGTSEYKVSVDEDSYDIYAIHKVAVKDTDGNWVDIPRKTLGEGDQDGLLSEETADMPDYYYEMGTSVVFVPTPSRSGQEYIKVWFDRSPRHFVAAENITPGIPSIYHSLIGDKAALKYSVIKNMPHTNNLMQLVKLGEERLDEYEANRRADEQEQLLAYSIDAR